jgi:preprotein translocase subunit SecE
MPKKKERRNKLIVILVVLLFIGTAFAVAVFATVTS